MQQPAEIAGNLARAAMLNAFRTLGLFLDAHIDLSRLHLKIAEAALEDTHAMEHELSGPQAWSSFAFWPRMVMRTQSTHSATALITWLDFTNKLQDACLHQLTEWNEQALRPHAQLSAAPLFTASSDALRAFFNSFNATSVRDSEAENGGQLACSK
ncbi:hypothetical protein [Ralstonia mannitolilytica]|uniref:hypothetical protein n=1 Tax=Ralstonia mannitolilytica TaxID=105219 RepID=UPI00292FBE52|nr:hypothetical protein [Ralstonia mannitolilytica]